MSQRRRQRQRRRQGRERGGDRITLDIAEGSYARGRNRQSLYQVVLGSAKETRACLDVAMTFGYLAEVDEQAVADLSSICAVLYRLVT